MASLKPEVDKLDIDKLAPVLVDLSKLSDIVKNDIVRKSFYDQLAAKVNNIDTSAFVLKTKYQTDKAELEKKIPNVTDFVKKTKLTELEKIPDVSTLATKTALTAVENNITANKSKHLLIENAFKKLKTFDLVYFIGKSHFEEPGAQNYSVFQPIKRYFKLIANTDYVSLWKSKELSSENIKPPTTSDNILAPALSYYGTKTRVKFNGSCLKQPKPSYTHGKTVNIYIVYELGASSSHSDDPTLKKSLFGAVRLTKNTDIDKYGIQVMELDLIENQVFHFQVVDLVKM